MEVNNYTGGGTREKSDHKPTFKYLPRNGMDRLGLRYRYGELKYGAGGNFLGGLPVSDCWDSSMRHLLAYQAGDNSEDHLAAVLWNVLCIMHTEEYRLEFQDFESRMKQPCSSEYYNQLMQEELR